MIIGIGLGNLICTLAAFEPVPTIRLLNVYGLAENVYELEFQEPGGTYLDPISCSTPGAIELYLPAHGGVWYPVTEIMGSIAIVEGADIVATQWRILTDPGLVFSEGRTLIFPDSGTVTA